MTREALVRFVDAVNAAVVVMLGCTGLGLIAVGAAWFVWGAAILDRGTMVEGLSRFGVGWLLCLALGYVAKRLFPNEHPPD